MINLRANKSILATLEKNLQIQRRQSAFLGGHNVSHRALLIKVKLRATILFSPEVHTEARKNDGSI